MHFNPGFTVIESQTNISYGKCEDNVAPNLPLRKLILRFLRTQEKNRDSCCTEEKTLGQCRDGKSLGHMISAIVAGRTERGLTGISHEILICTVFLR